MMTPTAPEIKSTREMMNKKFSSPAKYPYELSGTKEKREKELGKRIF